MTSLYGSGAVPKRVMEPLGMLEVFYQTMEEDAPGAWQLNQMLENLWQPYAKSHDWVLPDNFHAHIKVTTEDMHFVKFAGQNLPIEVKVNRGVKHEKSLGPNIIHGVDGMIVREIGRRCSYDAKRIDALRTTTKQASRFGKSTSTDNDIMVVKLSEHARKSGFLSAKILEYVEPSNMGHVYIPALQELLDSLPRKPFNVISNHDCFRVLPNYGNDLRQQYNQILYEIARSNMLEFLIEQILHKSVVVQKRDDFADKILDADYALS